MGGFVGTNRAWRGVQAEYSFALPIMRRERGSSEPIKYVLIMQILILISILLIPFTDILNSETKTMAATGDGIYCRVECGLEQFNGKLFIRILFVVPLLIMKLMTRKSSYFPK